MPGEGLAVKARPVRLHTEHRAQPREVRSSTLKARRPPDFEGTCPAQP